MSCPDEVVRLVERFDRNREAYTSGSYNETQLRREFIDPLFIQLGWDVNNEKGWAEAYKDVVHEDSIKVGGSTKAPDYCFRIGGARKFFLEAKKPSVNLKDDIPAAFQLRRYAWSAKLPLSILTDFEEFAVYDCRVKPHQNDKPSTARTKYLKFDKYTDEWEWISGIFSREAILQGSFDKYAASKKRKRGTAEVDDAFLKEIEHWRDLLARNIALRNKNLSRRDLNYAVQRTIDRIIIEYDNPNTNYTKSLMRKCFCISDVATEWKFHGFTNEEICDKLDIYVDMRNNFAHGDTNETIDDVSTLDMTLFFLRLARSQYDIVSKKVMDITS